MNYRSSCSLFYQLNKHKKKTVWETWNIVIEFIYFKKLFVDIRSEYL